MPMIGPLEIMLVALVALLVFGPEKLPELARTVGRTATQLRRMAADVKEEFNAELNFDDDEDKPVPAGRRTSANRAAGAISSSDEGDYEPDDMLDDREGDPPDPDPDPEADAVAADPGPDPEAGAVADDLERLNRDPDPGVAELEPDDSGDDGPIARSPRPATDAEH